MPAASFGPHLTMKALAVRLTVPAAGPVEDLHLQASVPCRAHIEKGLQVECSQPECLRYEKNESNLLRMDNSLNKVGID